MHAIKLAFLISLSFIIPYSCSAVATEKTRPSIPFPSNQSYFPLTIGNEWKYKCSSEGQYKFDKTIKILAATEKNGVVYFKTELKNSKTKRSQTFLLFSEKDKIYKTRSIHDKEFECIVDNLPKPGKSLSSKMKIGQYELVTTPATGKKRAILIENFDFEQMNSSADELMLWMGKWYVKGIGCIAEADGLAGECVLTEYHLK